MFWKLIKETKFMKWIFKKGEFMSDTNTELVTSLPEGTVLTSVANKKLHVKVVGGQLVRVTAKGEVNKRATKWVTPSTDQLSATLWKDVTPVVA